jgi:hypothetical protein
VIPVRHVDEVGPLSIEIIHSAEDQQAEMIFVPLELSEATLQLANRARGL